MSNSSTGRQCACWTDYRNGRPVACSEPATKMVWRNDGRVYYYCDEHATEAAEYFPKAEVMDP